MEVFKDIPGWEGYYQASNMGRIKSVERAIVTSKQIRIFKEGILKHGKSNSGYCYVILCKNERKMSRVHRLVLAAFLGPSNLEVNHKNCIKTDNRLENLEYVTRSENIQHAYKKGIYKNIKKVYQFDLKGIFIKVFDSTMDVERKLGINNSNISSCCRGGRDKAGGYKWCYSLNFI